MNNLLKLISLLVAGLALSGCSDGGSVEVHDAEPESVTQTPIADSLKQPMDKALAVEDMAMERKAEMDKRLAEMEGDDDADDGP